MFGKRDFMKGEGCSTDGKMRKRAFGLEVYTSQLEHKVEVLIMMWFEAIQGRRSKEAELVMRHEMG